MGRSGIVLRVIELLRPTKNHVPGFVTGSSASLFEKSMERLQRERILCRGIVIFGAVEGWVILFSAGLKEGYPGGEGRILKETGIKLVYVLVRAQDCGLACPSLRLGCNRCGPTGPHR